MIIVITLQKLNHRPKFIWQRDEPRIALNNALYGYFIAYTHTAEANSVGDSIFLFFIFVVVIFRFSQFSLTAIPCVRVSECIRFIFCCCCHFCCFFMFFFYFLFGQYQPTWNISRINHNFKDLFCRYKCCVYWLGEYFYYCVWVCLVFIFCSLGYVCFI